jgi:hypothetical protein
MSNGVVVVPSLAVAPHVEVADPVPLVRQLVHERRVAVEREDDGPVDREGGIELLIVDAVRMLRRVAEAHEVDHIDQADRELGDVLLQQPDGGDRLDGRHVARAGEHDIRNRPRPLGARPLPDAQPARAVFAASSR